MDYLCRTAEELLMSKLPGYFLIRVSESRIGYTLSYRYMFAGFNAHLTLTPLIQQYKVHVLFTLHIFSVTNKY